MSVQEILSLLGAAFAAGVINAVAGGGTMITFPVLLLFGTPAIVANATSTLALVIGTAGSIFGYRRHIDEIKPWLARLVPVSLVGGGVGSVLLLHTSDTTFTRIVPFLLLFATLLFLAQSLFKAVATQQIRDQPTHHIAPKFLIFSIVAQFAVAIYGGYFGAGIGILMLASLGFLGLSHIHEMNALKNVLGSLINVVAAIIFICGGLIDWPKAGVMTIGALAGYLFGSTYSQKLPHVWVRRIISAVGLGITGYLFFRQLK
ncbi:MAG: sulfite exporter TauE/SafE family protein [Chthoniobacterales bacterium]